MREGAKGGGSEARLDGQSPGENRPGFVLRACRVNRIVQITTLRRPWNAKKSARSPRSVNLWCSSFRERIQDYVMKPSTVNIQESEVLVAAIERVIRQLTKMLVGRIAFPKYIALVRKIFVEEAEEHLKKEKTRTSTSLTDLGLITGIDTRTLTKIRESDDYGKPISQSSSFFTDLTPEAVIVDKWQSDPEFADGEGRPAKLEIWGNEKTFESLVQSTVKSRGITVKSIMKRLLDTNSISISEDGKSVVLHPDIWVSYQSTDAEGVVAAGLLAVSQHLNTVINNIKSVTEGAEPRFERLFWCNRLDPSKLEEFRVTLEKFLDSVSNQAVKEIEVYDKDIDLKEKVSGGVGFYYFDTETS